MKDLKELNINEGGEPVLRQAPTREEIQQFEGHFGVALPHDYLKLLSFSNGGHPEVDSFVYHDGQGESAINRFFHLDSDQTDLYSVWKQTEYLRNVLQEARVDNNVVAIAENGGGDNIFLDMSAEPPSVHILYRTSGNSIPKISNSFSDFIDKLYVDPDMI